MGSHDDEIDIVIVCILEDIIVGISSPNSSRRLDTAVARLVRDRAGGLVAFFFELRQYVIETRTPSPVPETDAGWSPRKRTESVVRFREVEALSPPLA